MSEQPHRVHIEQLDWRALFPFLRLLRGFRMAIHPAKLLPALLLVVLTYLGGMAMDLIWGPQVLPGEFERYQIHMPEAYQAWLDTNEAMPAAQRRGIFETALALEVDAFNHLINSALSLNFGFSELLAGGARTGGVLGALTRMIVTIPAWLYATHPGFLFVFLLCLFLLTALVGGAISRLAALHACRDLRVSPFAGLRFAAVRYPWFLLAPVIPVVVALGIGMVMAVAGFALFNWPVLDVVGALLFGLFIVGGLAVAVLLIGLLLASTLLFPALAVEGTDAFDAISRAFNYVGGRLWRFLFYNVIMLVYGAITYLFVGMVIFLTLWVTKAFTGLWVFREASAGQDRLDAILPDPLLGNLMHTVQWDELGASATIAAAIIMVWVKLLIALLPAYAISYFFTQQTWIYLLLRRAADGSDLEEVYLEDQDEASPLTPPEKIEPA